ncbi:MAG TPA: hemolysin family protein [Propionibacteriaceae bacterium]|nr:hemolysin family protein [Propionibacteriaceae bacterium]
MNSVVFNIALILVLVGVGAVFVAAELALVSLRESQVKQLAHRGKRGQLVARLTADPNVFLSAVQVGVTLSGFLAAAFGADRLAGSLGRALERLGLPEGFAHTTALVLVTVVISYISIVVGELTAKRLALQRAEGYSLALAPLVNFIARVARPVIWLLGKSTDVVVRLVGGDPTAAREEVTDEEIRTLVSGSTTLGAEERQIVEDVFAAGERGLREVMVPRTEVDFLPASMPAHQAVREVIKAPHSRYPVTGESADDILGFVHVRDLLDPEISTRSIPVAEVARPVLTLPETARVLRALTEMRRAPSHLAIVLDEYGGTAGIVTMEDLVEELVGDITDEYDVVEDRVTLRGALVVGGLTTLDEFADETGFVLPDGHYDTVAGYFMAQLGQLPDIGDVVRGHAQLAGDHDADPVTIELRVTELDRRRASSFVVRRMESDVAPAEATG